MDSSNSDPVYPQQDMPEWNSKPAWKLPGWAEPIIVVAILFGAMWFTRKRHYRIFDSKTRSRDSYLDDTDSARTSDELLSEHASMDDDSHLLSTATAAPPKRRHLLGLVITTPNSSRFKNNVHSRILQRFPFLIEMFYWVINYLFYRMTSIVSQRIFAKSGIWEAAQSHGLAVLDFEEFSSLSILFPVREREVQLWFMDGHQTALTTLNRIYALIHIPGTVGFIAWYYFAAPSHPTFATVRRTVTLTNFLAFITFVLYPCMPPRLLPAEYGFLDTVRHDDAQSVWMSGKYVNSLAAMPSIHFAYAFSIGCTFIYHSGVFRTKMEKGESRKSAFGRIFYVLFGIAYPLTILITIIATANHYFLDAMVGATYVALAFACNKIFYVLIPVEDWLLWLLRVDKPVPSTGERFRAAGYGI